jgi:2-octaprenyl-6-methoxyphenol hydroxylase
VVVLGNAAHALHPVAGQGFNLALRDADRLAGVLLEACSGGAAPGDLALLRRYVETQQPDQDRTIAASDLLPSLFMHNNPALGAARDAALSGLDFLPPLKRRFVHYAAGVGGAEVAR